MILLGPDRGNRQVGVFKLPTLRHPSSEGFALFKASLIEPLSVLELDQVKYSNDEWGTTVMGRREVQLCTIRARIHRPCVPLLRPLCNTFDRLLQHRDDLGTVLVRASVSSLPSFILRNNSSFETALEFFPYSMLLLFLALCLIMLCRTHFCIPPSVSSCYAERIAFCLVYQVLDLLAKALPTSRAHSPMLWRRWERPDRYLHMYI